MANPKGNGTRQLNFLATVAEKVCTRCQQTKTADNFGPRMKALDGLRDWCNQCGSEHQQKYYQGNLEINRARKREWMARQRQDPQKRRAINEQSRASYCLRKERTNKAQREKWATRFFWARASKLGKCSLARELASMWKRQRGRCALTGRKLDRTAQLDHIRPRATGGGDEIANLQWTCAEVNQAKRDLTQAQFVELCRDVIRNEDAPVIRWIGRRILASYSPIYQPEEKKLESIKEGL